MKSLRRDRRKPGQRSSFAQTELLEIRRVLSADYSHTILPRNGVPTDYFGTVVGVSEEFHVVGNPFPGDSPPGGFAGEVQIHDPETGALLRTIANPDPDDAYRFGISLDIEGNLLVVGAVGFGEPEIDPDDPDPPQGPFSDKSGRAYLYNVSTGALLFRFDGTYVTGRPATEDHDGFGSSVSIDGNYVVVGAVGFPPDDATDEDPGHAYIFSATTGALLHTLVNPSMEGGEDFGAFVSADDGRLLVTNSGTSFLGPSQLPEGVAYVYDLATGALQQTLTAPAGFEEGFAFGVAADGGPKIGGGILDGSVAAIGGIVNPGPNVRSVTHLFDATTGAFLRTLDDNSAANSIGVPLVEFEAGRLVARHEHDGTHTDPFAVIRNPTTGAVETNIDDPDYVSWGVSFNPHSFSLHNDQLAIGLPRRQAPPGWSARVFVYDVTNIVNQPPTDIDLSANTVAENSANDTIIGTLTATDPDPGDTLTFSLVTTANGRFKLNGSQLRVNNGSLLNFESSTSHTLTVRVTDSAGNTYDESITVNLTDVNESATTILLSPNLISENTIAGALVGVLSTNDPDANDPQTYELLNAAGGRFVLDGGQIRVGDETLLDFETASSHQITVRVTDTASHVFEQAITINVTDFNYTPTDIELTGDMIREGSYRVLKNPDTSRLNGYGSRMAASETRLLVAQRQVTGISEQYTGQVQLYDVSTHNLLATLQDPAGVLSDRFGYSVATAANYAVVGSPGVDGPGTDAGRVYVFDATTGAMLHVLSNPDQAVEAGNDSFGAEVSISGSVIAVGANSDATVPGAGAVYLFDAVSGNLLTTIPSPEPASSGSFGSSISMAGNRLLIGASNNDATGNNSGRAYLYEFNSGTNAASLVVTIDNPTPGNGDFFGEVLAMSSGVLAISSFRDDAGGSNSGVVHLFNATTGAYLQTLLNPTPATNDFFGSGVAVAGDRVIVSTSEANNASGHVYLFDAVTGVLQGTIENPTPAVVDQFGYAVTATSTQVIASAFGDDSDGPETGRVYVFDLPFGESVGTLTASDPEPGETFTFSLIDDAQGRFRVEGNQVVVADATKLDYEANVSHTIVVEVTDAGGATRQETFTIQIQDVVGESKTVLGTASNDAFVVTYSSSDMNTGTVSVTRSVNGGPAIAMGTFSMAEELIINGLDGIDSVTIVGTAGADTFAIAASVFRTNNSVLLPVSIEARSVSGEAGNDLYDIDANTPLGLLTLNESGGGVDVIRFQQTSVDLWVDLSLSAIQTVHPQNLSLELSPATGFENLIGGSGSDTLIGNTLANTITGGPGNDTLIGAGGNDNLFGGTGNDTFVFNAVTSDESDYIAEYFDQGNDEITFASLSIPITLTLNSNGAQAVHTGRTLTLNSTVTFENLAGGVANDILNGNTLNNTLAGNAGSDALVGGAGSDTLIGGIGSDQFVFANATSLENDMVVEASGQLGDTITFVSMSIGVTLDLGSTAVQPVHTNRTLQLSGNNAFENIIGGSGNDVLTGNSAANGLTGNGGNDILDGRGGNDSLYGAAGNDTYLFSPAAGFESDFVSDAIGGGTDTLDFSLLTTAVSFDLSLSASQTVHANRSLSLSSGESIENLIGGSGNDNLRGNSLKNIITGGSGNDVLHVSSAPAGEVEELIGNQGNDQYVFYPQAMATRVSVSELASQGTDTLNFSLITSSVSVWLSSTAIYEPFTNQTLQISSGTAFENLSGGSNNDVLHGNDLNNVLTGNGGDDSLYGKNGNDSLVGGLGQDTLYGESGSDSISGGMDSDTYVFHAASSAEADEVFELDGEGTDAFWFNTLTTDVQLDLANNGVQPIHVNRTLKLNSSTVFEDVRGGSGNDVLTGNSGPNALDGGPGNDTLVVTAGNDFLYGVGGNDTYVFRNQALVASTKLVELVGEGTDTLDFSQVTASVGVWLNSTAIYSVFSNQTLQLNFNNTFENVIGGSGSDIIHGNTGSNTLVGGTGDDTLYGYAGRDILFGSAGTDTLHGGLDDDILTAGTTSSDSSLIQLLDIQTAWNSPTAYANRVTSLRAGVGPTAAALQAGVTVLTDPVSDSLFGNDSDDWFLAALDDVIGDLLSGELLDVL